MCWSTMPPAISWRAQKNFPRTPLTRCIGIVLKGTINMTMACGRRWLAANHKGVVLSIATTYADTGSAYVVPSAVAKAGVVSLMRSLAVEWGPRGIRTVAIAPGAIRTEGAFSRLLPTPELEKKLLEHNPLHRFGTLEEIANLGAFLVSDQAGYINGEMVYMDGGETLAGREHLQPDGPANSGRCLGDDEA